MCHGILHDLGKGAVTIIIIEVVLLLVVAGAIDIRPAIVIEITDGHP